MKILQLKLKNFKGIKEFVLNAEGRNVNIYGDNATGKTTIYDAFLWLLFDRDSTGRNEFSIKTIENGKVVHGLTHAVEAIIDIRGKTMKLKKFYAEKWTKKRGSAKSIFTGHATKYYVNEEPLKKNEYEARISSICEENIFKLLTNPVYFNAQLKWEKRREILLEICGDVPDEEVIASDSELSSLSGILGARTLEQHKKIIAERRKSINDDLKLIPARIDEVKLSMPDITNIIVEELDRDMEKLKTKISNRKEELIRIKTGGVIAEKRQLIAEMEATLISIENEMQKEINNKIRGKETEQSKSRGVLIDNKDELKTAQLQLERINENYAKTTTDIEELRREWYVENERQYEIELDEECPTCGQKWPNEHLEAYKERGLAQFNQEKAARLEQISASGKKLNKCLDKLTEEYAAECKKVDSINDAIKSKEEEIESINAEIKELKQKLNIPPEVCKKIQGDIEKVEADIKHIETGNRDVVDKIQEDINFLEATLDTLKERKQEVKRHNECQARITELEAQERELAAEYERLEQELHLADLFIRTKVQLLDDKINSRFRLARFKLFREQINGGIEPCCETLYDGVPYNNGLNSAARIQVGLDIIKTLSGYYEFKAPIFIDNRESVVNVPEMECQIISLIVSEKDPKLRVELG